MDKKTLEKAITDCRRVIAEYERSTEPSELFVKHLRGVEKELLGKFFATVTKEKPTRRAKKRKEKPTPPTIKTET